MTLRIASMTACALLAAPVLAQSDDEPVEVDLDAIDAMLRDSVVTEGEDADGDAAEEDAGIADGDEDGPAPEDDGEESAADETEDGEGEISDLTRAFNGYSLCASEAGAALEEQGFAIDQIGSEALLRCGGQRAAYVNAFYFDLLPRYPESTEQQVRTVAERLVAQSDSALMNVVAAEVRELRNARPESDPTDANEAPDGLEMGEDQ